MKKFILLSGIIFATLTSCSTDDDLTFEGNSNKKNLVQEGTSESYITSRDSISKANDSIASDPAKPKKD